ncbi:MAG: HEAT repeat domain-containing protein, partial [Candidatus Eiseniibacteriota bacterium]
CALFWFHPGVWWAAARLQVERERACDDRVLAARTRASDYADQLLDMVRSLRATRLAALGAVAFARPSTLEGRLLAVLDPRRDRRAVGRRVAAPAALVATLLLLPFAALEPVAAGGPREHGKRVMRPATSDPNALRPSRVTPVPDPDRSLEERAAWARTDAARAGDIDWWIGWSIETTPHVRGNLLGDSEGFSLDMLSRRGAFTLEDVLAGRERGTNDDVGHSESGSRPVALLVRMTAGGPARVRVQSPELPAEFWGEPLYWLDAVPEDQAFTWLRDAAERARNERMRCKLVESISFMRNSERVRPYLTATFRDQGAPRVRASAAEGLARHPSPEGARLLATAVRTDRSPEVRRACVEALGKFQTSEALEALLEIARASEGSARRAAFDALGDKVSRQAPEGDAPNGEGSPEGEAPQGEPADGVAHEKEWKVEQKTGDRTEWNSGPPDEPSQPMSAADLEVQRQAIESLGRYPESQSLQRLWRIAETSPNGELRAQAVESISRLGTPAALSLLDQIVWKNRQSRARQAAVEGMGRRFPADQALDKLLAIARTHPSRETRRMAVELVGRLDSPRALHALDQIVAKGTDVESQRQATESMARLNDGDVERRLVEIARTHRSIEVRRQAVESIGRHKGDGIAERLMAIARAEGPVEVQRQATESLGRIADPRAKDMLVELALRHPSIEVERQAVESLGRLKGDVMDDLAQIARSHRSTEVRRQAVESMTRRDPDQALPLLEEILRQPGRKSGT